MPLIQLFPLTILQPWINNVGSHWLDHRPHLKKEIQHYYIDQTRKVSVLSRLIYEFMSDRNSPNDSVHNLTSFDASNGSSWDAQEQLGIDNLSQCILMIRRLSGFECYHSWWDIFGVIHIFEITLTLDLKSGNKIIIIDKIKTKKGNIIE